MAKWPYLPPLTREGLLAPALCSGPWAQQGATSKAGPFSRAAASTISVRPTPLAHDDSSPVEGSATVSGFEQAGIARGTNRRHEIIVPGAYANLLLAPMAGAASIGVNAPTREPPAMQWARDCFQESAWLGTQPRESWQSAGMQQKAQAQAQAAWGAVLHSCRPTQGLGRHTVDTGPVSSAPRADAWPQTYEPAGGGRQWGAKAGGGPAAAAVPGRHNSGNARGVAAMLAAMADAKERQADDMRTLGYIATAAACAAQQQALGEPSSLAPAAAAKEWQAGAAVAMAHMGRQGFLAPHQAAASVAAEVQSAVSIGVGPAGSLARAAFMRDSASEGISSHEALLQALRQHPGAGLHLHAALGLLKDDSFSGVAGWEAVQNSSANHQGLPSTHSSLPWPAAAKAAHKR